MLYKKSVIGADEKTVYSVDELDAIKSVIENFIFFVQPKWKIATDKPGSGDTRNIGGVNSIEKLTKGEGVFAKLGEDIFDDYWMNYYSSSDAKNAGMKGPNYTDFASYKKYLKGQQEKLKKVEGGK